MLCLGGSERSRHSATRVVLLGEIHIPRACGREGRPPRAKRVRCAPRKPTGSGAGPRGPARSGGPETAEGKNESLGSRARR